MTYTGVGAKKEDFANWIVKGLKKALTFVNIFFFFFKAMGIWPLDESAIDGKMTPWRYLYIERGKPVYILR